MEECCWWGWWQSLLEMILYMSEGVQMLTNSIQLRNWLEMEFILLKKAYFALWFLSRSPLSSSPNMPTSSPLRDEPCTCDQIINYQPIIIPCYLSPSEYRSLDQTLQNLISSRCVGQLLQWSALHLYQYCAPSSPTVRMDFYTRMDDSPPKPMPLNFLIVGYVSQLILYALIITYCILSPSLFSTIALGFMLLSFLATLATPYYIVDPANPKTNNKKDQTDSNIIKKAMATDNSRALELRETLTERKLSSEAKDSSQAMAVAYPVQSLTMIAFTLLNLAVFIWKLYICLSSSKDKYTPQEQEFYEIQNNLYSFLPLLLLPFSVGAILVKSKSRPISEFKSRFNHLLVIPIFLALGILIVLIQIFSISMIGLAFFLIALSLFFQRKIDFNSISSWVVVIIILVASSGAIIANFICTTSLLRQRDGMFLFYGVDSLNKFTISSVHEGYIICLIIVYIFAAFIQRIFCYHYIWMICNNVYGLGEIKESEIFLEQGIDITRSHQQYRNTHEREMGEGQERRVDQSRNKVRGSLRQLEMQSMIDRRSELDVVPRNRSEGMNDFRSGNSDAVRDLLNSKNRIGETSLEQTAKEPEKSVQSMGQRAIDCMLWAINGFVTFIYSTSFSLRATEIMSIIIIQRYNNVYSFVAVLWLALVASVQRTRVIFLATAFILLPVEIGNYIILFVYNAPERPFPDLERLKIYGFQDMELFWLDIIIFNFYLFYIITYILSASKQSRKTFYKTAKASNPPAYVLILAFLFRYTYLFTILGIFFLGFSKVNLMNLFYVIIFLVFFATGENVLIEQREHRSQTDPTQVKKVSSLTTYSRKYWFLIVYYTLICIIVKYIYFLFFKTVPPNAKLDPTGINTVYNWAFNFSLSSYCASNTTPLFLIFILAESQIIIYRSSIYLNYSFALMNEVAEQSSPSSGRKGFFRRSRKFLNSAVEMIMEFYYQSLYYVSGLIILACSYRWNLMGLLIVIVACYGILRGFNRLSLALIVFLDLSFLLINYCFLFITYPPVQNLIGTKATNVLNQIALFLGCQMRYNYNLTSVFALYIVIFYFSVECYRLSGILLENRFDEQGDLVGSKDQEGEELQDEEGLLRRNSRDTISSYEPTIIESEYEDKQFARNFNKGVILLTKRFYNTNLWDKYPWWAYFCRIVSLLITHIAVIIVLVCCLYFRLSISMFAFLLVYMVYYFFLFDSIGKYMETVAFDEKLHREFENFRVKESVCCHGATSSDEQAPSMITGEEATKSLLEFIQQSRQETILMRYKWKGKIWVVTSFMSVLFLVATYAAQFINSDFYKKENFGHRELIENALFVIGVSANNSKQLSFWRQVYFYYLMVFISLVEKLLIRYIAYERKTEEVEEKIQKSSSQQVKNISYLDDPYSFVDEEQCDFIEQVKILDRQALSNVYDGQYKNAGLEELKKKKSSAINEQDYEEQQFHSEANLLIYFQYKQTLIKINFLNGAMMMLLRFYLLMMLINLYEKSNVFAFAYLVSILFFWFSPLRFSMVRHINKIAICILLAQYIMLLLDINEQTSSLPLPYPNDQLSVLEHLLQGKDAWIQYLLVDFNSSSSKISYFFVSFLISSIIIFLTEIYYALYFAVSRKTTEYIADIYNRYEYITLGLKSMPSKDTVYLNYSNYKNFFYRFINLAYELLINNSYIVVSILVLILLSNVHNYISVALVVFACIYIYLGIFTAFSEDKNIYKYTVIFFNIVRAILFLLLFMVTVANIPVFNQTSQTVLYIQQLSSLSQVFLLFFIQLWLDLSRTQEFWERTKDYNQRVKNRQDTLIKVIAYQENENLIRRMVKRYKEVMWFQVNLKDALDIIDGWHKAMYKDKIPQFENLRAGIAPVNMENIKKEMKAEFARRPEEDESVVLMFKKYMNEHTNNSVRFHYYELMQYIVYVNHRVLTVDHCSIDIWDYVLEDYEKLNRQIEEADLELANITKIIQSEEYGERMDKLVELKETKYSGQDRDIDMKVLGQIRTPPKIFISIGYAPSPNSTSINPEQLLAESAETSTSLPQTLVNFVLSNFSYFLTFFIWVYYMINPCLLSLPFIVYLFSYEIISDKKLTSIMLLYIFSIIILGLFVQIEEISSQTWVRYFFYQPDPNAKHPHYVFATGYLYFIFIMIFINEEIKKYQGNKFKFAAEAENRLQGALRVLVNVDSNSELNLWKMKVDEDYEEKENNPMNYFSEKIEQHPEYLTECPLPTFFESFREGKTGMDFYPLIATVQIFLTIYLIFFYPFMVETDSGGLEESFKYFQFSSHMVIAVLVHVASIVMERWITLIGPQNPNKEKIKYCYTMVILGLFLIFIYYIAPTNQRNALHTYHPRGFLIAFSFFYFIYFFLSGMQIRFGYKKYKSLNSIMSRRRMFNNVILIGFTAVPFLYELKLMMDWAFCATSLKIFDWFRLVNIYYSAYKAKMQYFSSTGVVLGEPMNWMMKSVGWLGFIGILIVIFGPMILFSGLNPIAQSNLVIGGALELGIQIQNGNYFTLYTTSHFSNPPQALTPQQFREQNFQQVPLLQTLTNSDIPNQFQFVEFQPFSDSNWGISLPNFYRITSLVNQTIAQMQTNSTASNNFTLIVKYELTRRIASTIATGNNFVYPTSGSLNLTQLQSLYKTLTTCDTPTYLPNFYIDLIRLNTIGNSYKPRPIIYTDPKTDVNPYEEGVYLTLYCDRQSQKTNNTNNVFWALNSTNASAPNPDNTTDNGISMNVLCDKYQNLIGGLGFTALYTSVILVVANAIRGAFAGNLPQIPYFQNPKPDSIIQICEAIGTLRARKQYREQYLMYYQLIDIIRSPDMMKYLSGSFPMLIEQADEKRRRKEREEIQQARKNKIE